MKRIPLDKIKTIVGKPFGIPGTDGKTEDCTDLRKLLQLLVFNLPRQDLTMKDSLEAQRLIRQIDASDGKVLEIEEAEHDWIVEKVKDFGPLVFGVNAVVLKDALDNFERIKKPKDKAPGAKE